MHDVESQQWKKKKKALAGAKQCNRSPTGDTQFLRHFFFDFLGFPGIWSFHPEQRVRGEVSKSVPFGSAHLRFHSSARITYRLNKSISLFFEGFESTWTDASVAHIRFWYQHGFHAGRSRMVLVYFVCVFLSHNICVPSEANRGQKVSARICSEANFCTSRIMDVLRCH